MFRRSEIGAWNVSTCRLICWDLDGDVLARTATTAEAAISPAHVLFANTNYLTSSVRYSGIIVQQPRWAISRVFPPFRAGALRAVGDDASRGIHRCSHEAFDVWETMTDAGNLDLEVVLSSVKQPLGQIVFARFVDRSSREYQMSTPRLRNIFLAVGPPS